MNIAVQQFIQAEVTLVWRAWTESDRITKWFAPVAEIEPKLGGKFELYFNPNNKSSMCTQGCKIVQLEAPQLLAFEWKGPDPFADVVNLEGALTIVKVRLESVESGTMVYLEHSGWNQSEESLKAREWHVEAWNQMLSSLKSSMEAGEGILCCQ